MQVRILVKRDELTLEGIKQFYVNVGQEDWKLDLDVLDALPLHLKRELERAYGEDCGSSLHHHALCATVLIYRLSEELSSLCCQDCVGRSGGILRKECCMACRVY